MPVNRQINTERGFTLIEMIAGIVIFAVALVSLVSVFLPQARKGIDPIWQVRAVKLSQSILSEIDAKAFDENSAISGASQPCNEAVNCTVSSALGPEAGESRANFDDVDDYHGLILTGSQIVGLLGNNINFQGQDVYAGFTASVSVIYDQNQDGVNDDDADQNGVLDSGNLSANRKLIQISITLPDNSLMRFAGYKDNY